MTDVRSAFLAMAVAALAAPATFAESLARYNADPSQVTVSGISSGAIMAVQMHVAYSATFQGVAAFAGHPYYCGKGDLAVGMATCAQALTAAEINVPELVAITRDWASRGWIDDPANLARQKVYLFSGKLDQTVRPAATEATRDYYLNFTSAANITWKGDLDAGHGWISPLGKVLCPLQQSPYINDCQIDPQETFLTLFYGPLQPKRTGALSGIFRPVSQAEFIPGGAAAAMSVDENAWLYVPAACERGELCKVHVSYHGCAMGYQSIGDAFVRTSGINEWADTNRIIVLYPQAIRTYPLNGSGCWDWYAYTGPDFAKKNGAQMLMSKRMIDRITSGFAPVAAPSQVQATNVSAQNVKLAWAPVSGAAGYRVYRDGAAAGEGPVTSPEFSDHALQRNTTYRYSVRAVAPNGNQGPPSEEVTVTTR